MKDIVKRVVLKLTSMKNWFAIFSAVILGYIVFTRQSDMKEIGIGCLVIIGTYFGADVLQKKILK